MAFKSAADSDSVWARFLPPDVYSVLARASGTSSPHPSQFSSLKQLYFSLCHRPVLIDNGKLSFSLDRGSGKKCYMLSARALSIAWSDTPRYWTWRSMSDSRFPEVAVLITVCWLEIRGRIDVCMFSPSTMYAVFLVFKSTADFSGFLNQPIEVGVRLVNDEATVQTVYLDSGGRRRVRNQRNVQQRANRQRRLISMLIPAELPRSDGDLEVQEDVPREGSDRYPKERGDGWLEVELGEFYCDGDRIGELEMNVLQVKQCYWKSGLIIEGIEVRAKENN